MQNEMMGGSSVGPDLSTTAYKLRRSAIKIGVAPGATLGIRPSIRIGRPNNDSGAAPLSPPSTIGRPAASLIDSICPSVKLFMIQLALARYAGGNCAHSETR